MMSSLLKKAIKKETYFPFIFFIDFFRKLGNKPTSFRKLKNNEKKSTTPKGSKEMKFLTADSNIHLIPSESRRFFYSKTL